MSRKTRLFVNLTSESFVDFETRGKAYEVGAYGGGGFTEKNIYEGRPLELRKAYSRGSLWGKIGKIFTGSLEDIFDSVGDYKLIEPRAESKEDAISENVEILKRPERYIVFEVLINGDDG